MDPNGAVFAVSPVKPNCFGEKPFGVGFVSVRHNGVALAFKLLKLYRFSKSVKTFDI